MSISSSSTLSTESNSKALPCYQHSYLDSSKLRIENAKIKPLQSESIFKEILSILDDANLLADTETEIQNHHLSVSSNGDATAALFASDITVLVPFNN